MVIQVGLGHTDREDGEGKREVGGKLDWGHSGSSDNLEMSNAEKREKRTAGRREN